MLSQTRSLRPAAVALLAAALAAAPGAAAQNDTTRGLGDLGFMSLRPAVAATKPATARKKPVYRRAPSSAAPAADTPGLTSTLVGVTLWRLRPAEKTDAVAARMLVQEEVTATDDGVWTPERVDLETALVEGQHARFAVETPRDGYLYVLDREVYADGSTSPTYAIFPTTRTRGGSNKVGAGTVVEIPALTDDRAYFTVRRSRPDQTHEEFTIIVSPTPLAGVAIDRKPQQIPEEQLATWRRQFGGPAERVDLVDGVGAVYTSAEKAGGAAATARLTQDDPAPQTIFRVAGKPGDPILVSFRLGYK